MFKKMSEIYKILLVVSMSSVVASYASVISQELLDDYYSGYSDTFTVGGMISGLDGDGLVLQNTGDNLAIDKNGSFIFETALVDGSAYYVTILSQPTNLRQTCNVSNGSGTLVGGNVTNVTVTCTTNTFTIGGDVSGLAGTGLVLQNNAGDDLAIDEDGSFSFATLLDDGTAFAVTVLTQPTDLSQTCTVSNGSGTLSGSDVSSVTVTCVTGTFTVGGYVSGPAVTGLVLQNNAGDDLPIAAEGSFTFSNPLDDGSTYSVTVLSQPTDLSQTCNVLNGSGTSAGVDVVNVSVTCVIKPDDIFAGGFEG